MEEASQKLDLRTLDLTKLHSQEQFKDASILIAEECVNTGFFLVKPPKSIEQQMPIVLEAAKKFFQLPLEEKLKLENDEYSQQQIDGSPIQGTGCGYRAFGGDPNFSQDTRESFNMGPDVSFSEFSADGYTGSGMTKWPDDVILPGWKKVMQDYSDMLLEVCKTLRKLIAISLGLNENSFEKLGYFDKSTWILGLTHYFPKESNEKEGIFGIRPHTDAGIFTLLLTDGQPGLQVCLDKTAKVEDRIWLDVEPPPTGHLIVNLGQVLERWTDGKFKATLHRVILNGKYERLSVPFFYETNLDLIIQSIIDFDGESEDNYDITTPAKLMLERLEKANDDFE